MNKPAKELQPEDKAVAPIAETPIAESIVVGPAAIMQAIQSAAANPDVDIDKMERLWDMHKQLVNSQNEAAFNNAMTEAQSEMRRVQADARNPQTHSEYASYAAIDKALRPIYTRHRFALSFDTGEGAPDEYVRVVCNVSHGDGHSKAYHIDMPADGKGAKGGDVMTKTHAVGAGMSYGMRYLLKMIFNVAIGEDDNDGNEAIEFITEDQAADILALIKEVGAEKERFLKWCKSDSVEEIAVTKYARCVKKLEGMR